MNPTPYSYQRGNVLFLILIAVALFAALSYAVGVSTRYNGDTADNESADTKAATILQYASLIQSEVDRLKVANSLNYNEVDFYNLYSHLTASGAIGSVKGKNPNCTAIQAKKKCAVFAANGGAITARDFYTYSNMEQFVTSGHPVPGEAQFFNVAVENIGTQDTEIVMYITDLKKPICDAINRRLGLPLADTQSTIAWNIMGERIYWQDATDYSLRMPGTASAYIGQLSFCVRHSLHQYMFVNVLIPR